MELDKIYVQTIKNKRVDGANLIIINKELKIYILNEVAKDIFEMFDGNFNLKEIIEELCKFYEEDKKKISKDILHLTQQLLENKLIEEIDNES